MGGLSGWWVGEWVGEPLSPLNSYCYKDPVNLVSSLFSISLTFSYQPYRLYC